MTDKENKGQNKIYKFNIKNQRLLSKWWLASSFKISGEQKTGRDSLACQADTKRRIT